MILAAYAVPHPPLAVPSVGRGQEDGIPNTITAYHEVARRIEAHAPQTLVVISPHAPMYRDGFFVSHAHKSEGNMAQFGVAHERIEIENDRDFQELLADRMIEDGIPVGWDRGRYEILDHATFVPLHFVRDQLPGMQLVRVGLSGLPAQDHKLAGECIARVARELGRRIVIVASGDLSHKLLEEGPYGFHPAGPEFDQAITRIFAEEPLERIFELDEQMCDDAAECGLRSFQIMAGALEGLPHTSELLSYEGTYGVGYGVAAFEVEAEAQAEEGAAESWAEAQPDGAACAGDAAAECSVAPDADPLVALARETVEIFTLSGSRPCLAKVTDEELLNTRAGVFVSLHKGDDLRGCIGTIEPVQPNLAHEIMSNAISACSRDPRFWPVRSDELDFLSYSVDVLYPAEPVNSLADLDPKRYGVIVTWKGRRGLLLPDLEGVDTVEDQVAIAMQKAGIPLGTNGVQLERFEVVRHSRGGEARRQQEDE